MKHVELSDLFVETFTYAKQLYVQKNVDFIQYLTVDNDEKLILNQNDLNLVLTKSNDNLSLFKEKELVFSVPILENPNKDYVIENSHIQLISKIKEMNTDNRNLLGIKNSSSLDQEIIKNAVKVKRKNKI